MSGTDADRYARLVAILIRRDKLNERSVVLSKVCESAPAALLLGEALLAGEVARVVKLLRRVDGIPAFTLPKSRKRWRGRRATWKGFPADLRDVLDELAMAAEDAEEQARRVLAEVVPSRDRLEREIEALSTRLTDAEPRRREGMALRLVRLEERLEERPRVSRAQLAKAHTKLRRRALHARLDKLEANIARHAQRSLERCFGAEVTRLADSDPRIRSLLLHIQNLPTPSRELAL
jgi:hypothetical protein